MALTKGLGGSGGGGGGLSLPTPVTKGDVYYAAADGATALTRLPRGSRGQVLFVDNTDTPKWGSLGNGVIVGASFTGADAAAYLHYDARSMIGVDGSSIVQLKDQSGNARDTTGYAGAPVYRANAFGSGKPGIYFPGLAYFLLPSLSALTEGEIFIVIKADNDPGASTDLSVLWRLGTDTNDSHYPWTDGNIYDAAGTTSRKSVGNPTPSLSSSARLYNVVSKSGEWTARLDTTQIFTTATNTVGFTASPSLGGQTTGPRGIKAHVAEFRVYSTVRTSGQRTTIEQDIKTNWGLTGY